ncbi:EAL domain-containing response regulator [Demequina capsici]|uniref:EAL domain-containing response regulator n=1 Tax=Demequina capsici TaxID=3075620 RepID=A0AA96J8R1_9MICO|nr:EAL domain-containing response regulator [Demequina sp. OYTSA14]WNM25333.1 EAL domain-containing response regulator [Demequina sp. OYTSA14]
MTGSGCRRVLVIDDDELVAAMLVAHAQSAGYEARATSDPVQFFTLARQWRPCFVVVDLMMTGMDGLSVLQRLARERCRAAVVITSGAAPALLDSARTYAIESGLPYAGALPKPFRRGDVASVLDSAIAEPRPQESSAEAFARQSYLGFQVALRKALQDEEIEVFLQPKVSCEDGRVVGAEALARWNHPALGAVPPSTFVPYAERLGLAPQLTDLVMRRCLTWLSAAAVPTRFTVSINVSASELGDPRLRHRLMAACVAAQVSPSRVVLEVTETSTVDDAVGSLEALTRLGLEGFGLSVDDFGTGYSSVSQLARLPFSELKVDRSFVAGMSRSDRSVTVVRSMVQLADGLGLASTAEGVETEAQWEALRAMGCTHAQGFHLARPMPLEDFTRWVDTWNGGARADARGDRAGA